VGEKKEFILSPSLGEAGEPAIPPSSGPSSSSNGTVNAGGLPARTGGLLVIFILEGLVCRKEQSKVYELKNTPMDVDVTSQTPESDYYFKPQAIVHEGAFSERTTSSQSALMNP
jgi:hypothetical protein